MAIDKVKYAGRIDAEEVLLLKKNRSKVDLRPIFIEFNINAAVINSTVIADFTMHDAQNLLHKLPIEPGDVIQYTFTENETTYTQKFVIFKIKDIRNFDTTRSYVLRCHSELYYTSLSTKISRSYKGTYSDIALNIFQDYTDEGITAWEPSIGNRRLIVPFWTPVDTINWLSSKSISGNAKANMRFFQNTKTRYCFSSLEFIGSQQPEPIHSYKYNISTALKDGGIPNSENLYSKIYDIIYHDAFSFIQNMEDGVFAGSHMLTDLTSKTQEVVTYDYWRDLDTSILLNNNKLYRNDQFSPLSNKIDSVESTKIFPGIDRNFLNTVHNLKKSSLRGGQKITIVVDGNSVVDVGSKINVVVPTPEPQSDQAKYQDDMMWSGNYLVVAKRDMHQKEKHTMSLTLMKDSFTEEGYV